MHARIMRPLHRLRRGSAIWVLAFISLLAPLSATAQKAYIPNYTDGTVSVINTATNTVCTATSGPPCSSTATYPISVGTNPKGVAVTSDGSTAYIVNFGSNNISVISTATDTVTATFSVSGVTLTGPVAVTPNGNTLYAVNTVSGVGYELAAINTSGDSLITNISLTDGTLDPQAIAVVADPYGKFVCVAAFKFTVDGYPPAPVFVVGTSSNTITSTITGPEGERGLALSPDSKTAYVPLVNGGIAVVPLGGGSISYITTSAGQLGAIAVSPDGTTAYLITSSTTTISVMNLGSGTITQTITVGTNPVGMSFSTDGSKLYVANGGSNNVSVISTTTNNVLTTVSVGNLPDPLGVFIQPGAPMSGKELGPKTENCNACSAAGTLTSTGNVSGGEPIEVASGNTAYHTTDYRTAGPNALAFTRYYNSRASAFPTFALALGPNWRHTYDRYIRIVSSAQVIAERASGQQLIFTLSGSTWSADSDVDVTLTKSGSTWTLTDQDDTVETYTTTTAGNEALLNSIKLRDGFTETLSYNGSNQLTTVTDSNARTLTFVYATNGTLYSMTTPESNVFYYTFNSNNTLKDTISPVDTGGQTYAYQYGVASAPTLLTGIQDRYGEQINSWTYDASGRGLTSSQGGTSINANLTTLTYNSNGTQTVTNPLGVHDTYTFSNLQGVQKVTQISRASTSTTAAATETIAYDSNGYVNSLTDWSGNQTTYTSNSHGQPTAINEAVGSSVARTTTIVYDTTFVHLPDSITTPGVTTSFTYDSSGNPLTRKLTDTTTTGTPYSTNGQTRTWTYTYDTTGHVLTAKSPNSNTTTFTYDSSGALTKITNALSQAANITAHTAGGYPQTVVDPNSVSTTLTYDGQMRLASSALSTTGGTLTTTIAYWFDQLVNKLTVPDGSSITVAPDAALRPDNVQNSNGESIISTLDALGNQTQINTYNYASTLERKHSATFDALGRRLTDVGGAGQTTTFTYDADGNALTVKDGLSHTTTRTFDALNRLKTSTDVSSGEVQFTYDAHDRPLTVTDANSNTTTYIYDGFGDKIQTASPDTGTTVYHYDSDGNLTQKVDAASVTTNYTYDALDRIATVAYPADTTLNVAYTYDQTGTGFSNGIGRLTSLTDKAGSLTRAYDQRGNRLTEKRTNGSTVLTTSYTYDNASRIASITYPSGAIVSYSRDSAGQINHAGFSATGSDSTDVGWFAHMPYGPLVNINYAGSDLARFVFDQDYRLTGLVYENYLGTPFINWTYAYDNANNVSSITDNITSANSQTFGYDSLNRLTSASSSGLYGSLSYTFDHNGNLTSSTASGTTFTYGLNTGTNQLASITWPSNTESFTYTATGNMTTTTLDGTNVFTGTYSKANRLASVTGVPLAISANVYDAFGKRFSKANPGSTPNLYVYDQSGNLIEENNNGTVTDYIYIDDVNLANWAPSEHHLYYIQTDRLGVPINSRDEYGLTNWAAYTLPHGTMDQTVVSGLFTGPVTQNLRYPGQYFDGETDFHYNLNRDYNPSVGQYVEADPIGLAGGMNPYLYSNGNPLEFTDFYGLADITYNNSNNTMTLTDQNGNTVGTYPAANNAQSSSRGQWQPGTYDFDYHTTHPDDAPNSAYGSNGNYVFNVPGCTGCGVHSGRATTPDALGRTGPQHATNGCIRTTDEGTAAMQRLNDSGDPLRRLTVVH